MIKIGADGIGFGAGGERFGFGVWALLESVLVWSGRCAVLSAVSGPTMTPIKP